MSSYEFLGSLSAAELVQLKQEINAVDLGIEAVYCEAAAISVSDQQFDDVPF